MSQHGYMRLLSIGGILAVLVGTISALTFADKANIETNVADFVVALAADDGVRITADYSKADAFAAMVPVGVIVAVLGALMIIGYIIIKATQQRPRQDSNLQPPD